MTRTSDRPTVSGSADVSTRERTTLSLGCGAGAQPRGATADSARTVSYHPNGRAATRRSSRKSLNDDLGFQLPGSGGAGDGSRTRTVSLGSIEVEVADHADMAKSRTGVARRPRLRPTSGLLMAVLDVCLSQLFRSQSPLVQPAGAREGRRLPDVDEVHLIVTEKRDTAVQ